MRATRLVPLLLVACLLACTAEASGVQQLLQTRQINVAWTIGLQCKHTWLKNATYSFIDKLGNASLNDLKAYPGVSKVKIAGKGPCRDIIASWNAKMKMAGYMYAFTFTGTAAVQNKLLAAARKRGGLGLPDDKVWARTVKLPMADLSVQKNGKPMRLRANNGSTLASPAFSAVQYAVPDPPQAPIPSPVDTCANVTNGGPFVCPISQVLKPNPGTITSPNTATCCDPTCATWTCPPGYALVANATSITTLSNSTCCASTATCANINASSTNITPFSCPAGWMLKANASSISNVSTTTCCDVAATCGNVNASSGADMTHFACPAGYVLKPNATGILSPNVTTCCEATRTCADTNLTTSAADIYLCPLGWQLKANASSIVNLTDSSCCDAHATCANMNTSVTANGSATGVVPFTCPNGFVLPANASNITAVNAASCCLPLPTCTNISPNLTHPNITIPYTCPPEYGLRANASNVTELSNATCCELVPVNCTLVPNSLPSNTSNTCQCTKPGYLVKAMDGNTLKECLPSTATGCTSAAYPIVVRTADPTLVIDSCLTANTSACPVGFPLMQFSGNPPALRECRPSTQQCVTPYDLPVTTANAATVLACVQSSDNTCPMGAVAYREYNSPTPWLLQQCRMNGTCTNFNSATDRFTVPALNGSGSIVACLTLDPTSNSDRQQVCPAAPGANFPVDVTQALPDVCGSVAVPCTAARTVMCLAPGATCPPSYPFQLVRYNTPDVPGFLAGCRSGRAFCNLYMASMRPPTANGADPNAPDNGNYTINLRSGTNLVGCVQGGASACPSSYPFPSRSSTNGALQECSTNSAGITSCPTVDNMQNTVQAENQNGVVVECLSPFKACPPAYPVAAYALSGMPQAVSIQKCMARSSTGMCPASFPFPSFAPIPDPAAGGASTTMLTNCWQANVVTACNFQVFSGPQGYGVGAYTIEIRQDSASPLQGCMLSTTQACPAAFNFAFFSSPSTLAQCAAGGSCQSSGSIGKLYTIPLMDQGNVTGCGTIGCPGAFPVAAAALGGPPVACLTTRSQCTDVSDNYKFSLFKAVAPTTPGGLPVAVLDRCIPIPVGLTVCDTITGYTGRQLYNSVGMLVGCTTPNVTNCPQQFPYAFYDTAGSLLSCRTNIGGTCSQATGNAFPTPIYDDKGRLAGCTAASTCPSVPGVVILSETATSSAEHCITVASNACPPAHVYNDRSFPLYSGVTSTGSPRLVRCIRPFASPECSTTALYNVKIKNTIDGSGNVIGCMTASPATPCPVWSPFFYMSAAQALVECRSGMPDACNAPVVPFVTYTVRMLSADGGTVQGCMQAGAKRCPTAADGAAYNYPFFLLGDGSNMDECRQVGFVLADCQPTFTNYRGNGNTYNVEVIENSKFGSTGAIVGCAKSSTRCSAAMGYAVAQVSAAGAIEVCRPTGSNCSGTYPMQLHDATGTTVEGCAPALTDCPSPGWWTFGLYERTNATIPAAKLVGCRSVTAGSLTNCSMMDGYPVELFTAAGNLTGCSAADAQCPSLYPRWTLNTTAALDSCRAASGLTCPADAPIAMIGSTDGGVVTPLLGCSMGSSCPAGAPANSVPSSDAFTFYSLDASGATVECRPASSSPANSCTGRAQVVNTMGTVLGCMASASCPASYYQLYSAVSPQNATAVLSSCVTTQPDCSTSSSFSIPVYNSTLGDSNLGLAGCKAAAAACPDSAPLMALSSTSNTAPKPAVEGCYRSYASGTCPSSGAYTIPVCTWSNLVSTSCSADQVKGCLSSGSTRCSFSSTNANVGGIEYSFVVATITTPTGGAPQLSKLLACYQKQLFAVVSCPLAANLTALRRNGEAGACVSADSRDNCNAWWADYSGDSYGLCTL